jgi:putative membrane protein
MYWYGHGMDGWGFGLMAFSFLLFWALVVVAIVLLVRYFGRSGHRSGSFPPPGPYGPPPGNPAEQLLAERFARGEIDEEEYQRRLNTLRASTGPRGDGA